jgi:hypothetical protein
VYDYDGLASGHLQLTYLYPEVDRTISNLTMYVRDAGGTPTLARLGVYSVDASGNLTLLASTTNDTALITSAWTAQTKALSASVSLSAGSVYAIGLLIVSSNAMPSLRGLAGQFDEFALAPRLTGRVTGQTDLPSSIDYWDSWSNGAAIYVRGT